MKFGGWTQESSQTSRRMIGGALVVGFYAWSHEIYWVTVFNPRFGRFGFFPTLSLVLLGIVIILGALLFPAAKGMPSIEQERYERKHRQWMKRERYQKHYPPD